MRGTVAKRIRKEIYGKDYSPRDRQYKVKVEVVEEEVNVSLMKRVKRRFKKAIVFEAGRRALYQKAKRAYKRRFK